jgi:hypothetical protein
MTMWVKKNKRTGRTRRKKEYGWREEEEKPEGFSCKLVV